MHSTGMECPIHAITSLLASMSTDMHLDFSQPLDPVEEYVTDAPEPDLDIDQLEDITRSMTDPDAVPETDFIMTEELNMKIEVFANLKVVLTPDSVSRLQHLVPDVYYGDSHGDMVFTFAVDDPSTHPDTRRTVPTLCMFRWFVMTLREHLLNTPILAAVRCDTIACFQIDELLKELIGSKDLRDEQPCNCPSELDISPEDEDIKQMIHGGGRKCRSGQFVPLLSDLCDKLSQDNDSADSMDRCHCDLCMQRRAMDDGLWTRDRDEDSLQMIWYAFFGIQTFLECHAFCTDLSPLIYIEQRLSRITHYSLMLWFYENDLHTCSALYDCPCVDGND